jgi:far upstream element-binding protein
MNQTKDGSTLLAPEKKGEETENGTTATEPSEENHNIEKQTNETEIAVKKVAPHLPSGLPPGLSEAGGASQHTAPLVGADVRGAADPEAVVEENGEVSSLYVGRVIGKGGEMIRDLQARSGARIDVDQNVPPGMPRVITYRGSRKTVDFAKRLVYMLCQENVNEADLPLGEATREFLIVPASSVGKIIGRGGEMIRELQARSHAKIQVDHSGASGLDASEKQVTITGTEQSVVKGKEMVLFLVANPNMDAMQSLNMLVEDKVQRGGIWGSGPPYPNLPQNGQNMQPSAGGYGYDQSYYGGAPSGNFSGYAAASAQYAAPPVTVGGAYGVPPVAPYQQPTLASFGGGTETEIFPAAKTFMGRIIGSKGVTINDLQRRSACDIQINQDVPPGHDCEITIRGTRQGIEMVKQMLREIIEIGPNHPYAGGGGGGGHCK